MKTYARVLRSGGFGRLWLGASVSLLGDGMTFLALSWLVIDRGGAGQLGLLGVCFTAPVVLGGMAVGPLLDRVDKRTLLVCDSLFRAACVASIPFAAALGEVPTALPFVVAGVYGLLKMVPLAGFPAAIPQLVKEPDLDAANALESLSFSVATVIGPAAAGVLVGMIGAPQVLLIDALTYLFFAGVVASLRTPLPPQRSRAATGAPSTRFSLKAVGRDRVIVVTTVAFMLFNIAEGMLLLVVGPWLVKNELAGGAASLGLLIAALAAGEFIGAALAGSGRVGRATVRRIGLFQVGAALCVLPVLDVARPMVVAAGFFGVGLLSAPMTVWAQSLRMRRIPPELHGRSFAALRTLMQGTPPLGAAIAAPILLHGGLGASVSVMAILAGAPGLYLLLSATDHAADGAAGRVTPSTRPSPGRAARPAG